MLWRQSRPVGTPPTASPEVAEDPALLARQPLGPWPLLLAVAVDGHALELALLLGHEADLEAAPGALDRCGVATAGAADLAEVRGHEERGLTLVTDIFAEAAEQHSGLVALVVLQLQEVTVGDVTKAVDGRWKIGFDFHVQVLVEQ